MAVCQGMAWLVNWLCAVQGLHHRLCWAQCRQADSRRARQRPQYCWRAMCCSSATSWWTLATDAPFLRAERAALALPLRSVLQPGVQKCQCSQTCATACTAEVTGLRLMLGGGPAGVMQDVL